MPGLRESAFLPTIKCSSCGHQVEISLMGDHLCPGPSVELSPPPDSNDKFENPPFHTAPLEKYGRLPSPVDTTAANHTYLNQGQLTPVSQSGGSHNVSPISPSTPSFAEQARDYFMGGSAKESKQSFRGSEDEGVHHQQQSDSASLDALSTSASKSAGQSLTQRMNNIAPGPFNAMRKLSGSNDSLTILDGPLLEEPGRSYDRPGTSHSNISTASNGPLMTPRQPKKIGYEGFGPPPNASRAPESDTLGPVTRADTFPKPALSIAEPSRRPSYPSLKTTRMVSEAEQRPSTGRVTSRRPPPRKSLIPTDLPIDSVDLAAEFGANNPYHTPTDSASSGYSTFSRSQSSSQTSPARSEIRERTLTPDVAKVNNETENLQVSVERPRPADLRIDLAAQIPAPLRSPVPPTPYTPANAVSPIDDDRHDPAIQYGLGQSPWTYKKPSKDTQKASQSGRTTGPKGELSPGQTSPPSGQSPSRQGSRDPGQVSRGQCKACREPITGKSISSADGRLTGKYHKACFVCATCSSRFASAEFYVLNDKPYCEQHYHKLNGSLCGGCNRGIEGQFIEDESNVKHHLGCFCCLDCGRPLSDGYFEVDGKAYCERDALKRTQPSPAPPPGAMRGPPGSYPQGPRRGGYGPGPAPGQGPGPRPYGLPGPRPMGPPGGPGGPALRPYRPPGMKRGGPNGGPMPGRLAPVMGPGMGPGMGPPRPRMNKRATRIGNM